MFSSRTFTALAVLATVAALPTTEPPAPKPITTIYSEDIDNFQAPWLSIPLFGNLFGPLWKFLPSFVDISPKISSNENKFEVVVNVKDYNKDELKVKVKDGFMFVQGTRETKQDDRDVFASQFYHTYSLPVNTSSDEVTAQLTNDGYLIVTAPSSNTTSLKENSAERIVPIVETGKPFNEEKAETPAAIPTTSTPAPTTVSEDDRKEPTTPSEKEEFTTTEKDNAIPHGN